MAPAPISSAPMMIAISRISSRVILMVRRFVKAGEGELRPYILGEIAALGVGLEQVFVNFGWHSSIAIDLAAMKLDVQHLQTAIVAYARQAA